MATFLTIVFIFLFVVVVIIVACRADIGVASANPDECGLGEFISREQYSAICSFSKTMFEFTWMISRDVNFQKHTNYFRKIILEDNDSDPLSIGSINSGDFLGKVQFLTIIDLSHSLQRSGHPVDFSSKEGFGFFVFMLALSGKLNGVTYQNLIPVFDENTVRTYYGIAKKMSQLPESDSCIFHLSEVLNDYNEEWRKQYHVMMYRFISIISKCDGFVSAEEQNWSREIMNMVSKTHIKLRNKNIVGDSNESKKYMLSKTYGKIENTKNSNDSIDPKKELYSLIGLNTVKNEVESLANLVQVQRLREAQGMKTAKLSYHCVFTGNPGTGKTTVARILAKIYRDLGILKKGHLVETDRSGLVAEYVGQTAVKTNKIIDTALDGVLFIDEAYTLATGGKSDYGAEAIATLLKRMEDERDRLIVILAGYTGEMKQFINTNPGLQSRFRRYIEFPDYSAEDLLEIFKHNLICYEYTITHNASIKLFELFSKSVASKDKNFGNARFARNIFDRAVELQANRLAPLGDLTMEELAQITTADIPTVD